MRKWEKAWAYGSATVLWFASQLGLVDVSHVEASNNQINHSKIKAAENEPVYLEKTSTIQNSFDEIFSTDNLAQMAHYSHSSHSSHQSHSSHSSHYSHYSGTGDSGSSSGYYSAPLAVPEDVMDVRSIQKKLNDLGYDCGVVDGVKGDKTRESIRNFQMDYGLTMDGMVGPTTKEKLDAVDLVNIQKKLKQLGYDCNTYGMRDEKTIQAIKSFQAAEGLDSYGTINKVTKEAIENKAVPKLSTSN